MRFSLVAPVTLALAAASLANAQSLQVVGGRVLADSTHPLAGAIVSVTMAPDRLFKQDTTDAGGRWRVRFEHPSGDYLVHIAAVGRVSFRKRITVPATDSVVTVDATLAPSVQQLAAVKVEATRPKPSREGDVYMPDGVSAEHVPMGVTGAVAADMQGDLAALAATIPGLALTASGVSAFGLDPSQNGVTLNGLSFPGATLPRNANTSTRFSTSTYDPSRGGFAGVETAVTLSPGNINTHRRANLTTDSPLLQVTDRVSRQLGQRVTGGQGSIGGSGSIREDVWYYNVSADISRKVADAPSLVGADASLFPLAGVAPDSVARLLHALAGLGIPASVAGQGEQRVNDDASFAVRFDHAPYKPQSFVPNTKTWALVGLGRVQRSDAQGVSLTATPGHGSGNERDIGVVQAIYSTFIADYSLSETRSGLSVSRTRGTPYLQLPDGSVLISSNLPDGSLGVSALTFGGNARSDVDDTQWSWETRTDYQWFARATHRLKLTAQSKFDGYHQEASGNTLGRFGFASLADLAANRPSSFSRSLAEPDRNGSLWSGFASLGDQWRVSPTLQLVYGARVEANRFLMRPPYNAALESALGVRTDAAPSHMHVSPRLGFSWRYGGERAGYRGFSISEIATKILPPSGLLRGGIGEFRAALPAQLLSAPSVFTGLPGGARRVSCIGDAVPAPNWSAYASDPTLIPTSCLVVPDAPTLSDVASAVQTIDPSFDAPRSWRANLGWMSMVKKVGVSLDGSIALNVNQPSVVDLNFSGAQRFILPDEGRAVFTSAAGIVPATGLLSSVEARRSSTFGSVVSRKSDLRSFSRQLTITLAPQSDFGSHMNVAYTLSSTRGDVRGFDGSAFGDPRLVEKARTAFDVRHRFQIQAGKALPRGFSATLFLTAASGTPYTPLVNGDVNGDGIARDRAFVADPSRTQDAALAAGMQSLLASAPSHARACLLAQLGRAAGINSCEGPWSATATGRIGIANAYGPWGRRVNASLSITNPLAGVDQALHGESGLHGWGMSVFPDPVLLTVRGFDPATSRFRYDVNPRFGSTSPSQTTVRVPFRATLDVSFELSPSTARQQLERVLNRGRKGHAGARLSADSIRMRFARNVRSPYETVIEEADSLLLSREQVERLRAAEAKFALRVDSIWAALGRELAALEDDYDAALATQKTEDATDRAWEVARDEVPTIKAILSPLQFSLAPGIVQYLASVKGKVMIRMYSY